MYVLIRGLYSTYYNVKLNGFTKTPPNLSKSETAAVLLCKNYNH